MAQPCDSTITVFSPLGFSPQTATLICHERLCPSPTQNPFPDMSARELLDFVAMALQEVEQDELIFMMDDLQIPAQE